LCQFLSDAKAEKFVDLSPHHHCGLGTYLFIDREKVTSIKDHLNVEGLYKSIISANSRLGTGRATHARFTAVAGILKNIQFKQLHKFISALIFNSDYHSLDHLHHSMIFISSMHFMDPYNFDLERVKRCVIHYPVPDGRIIPFCAMNNLYRQEIEKKFSRPFKEASS
jgi:uncharacterized radical SAM superfamily Fe-S cluster-containing enzyme